MTTDQKEKRNDEYNKYVKRVTPTHFLYASFLIHCLFFRLVFIFVACYLQVA